MRRDLTNIQEEDWKFDETAGEAAIITARKKVQPRWGGGRRTDDSPYALS